MTIVNVNLELADLTNAVAALRQTAAKLADYGAGDDAAKFRAIADRLVEEMDRGVQRIVA